MGKKKNWERFEIESCQYLNKNINDGSIRFEEIGGSDSNKSDIQVYKKNVKIFTIEAKYSPSQSGQFVVIEKQNKFILSQKSIHKSVEETEILIDYLNENQTSYNTKDQKAIELNIKEDVLAKWIISHYRNKRSYFIITSNQLNSYKAIIPIDELQAFFNISAVLRRKRSGTVHVPAYRRDRCIKELREYIQQFKLDILKVFKASKTLVIFDKDIEFNKNQRIFGYNQDYYLSPNTEGKGYYLKVRSNINNLNVIFNLEYNGPKQNLGLENLLHTLDEYA